MYNTIVFDVGNVLLSFQPLDYLRQRWGDSPLVRQLCDLIFNGKEWLQLDQGLLTAEEATAIFCTKMPDKHSEIQFIMEHWCDMLHPLETIQLLEPLHRGGYALYYLSNFHDLAYRHVREQYDFWDYFDGGVLSFQEKLIKPDPKIYECLLHRYNRQPADCLFLDDSEPNILKARELGITGILFRDAAQCRKELGEILHMAL